MKMEDKDISRIIHEIFDLSMDLKEQGHTNLAMKLEEIRQEILLSISEQNDNTRRASYGCVCCFCNWRSLDDSAYMGF